MHVAILDLDGMAGEMRRQSLNDSVFSLNDNVTGEESDADSTQDKTLQLASSVAPPV